MKTEEIVGMEKERRDGITVGLPAVLVSKLEDLHRRTEGAHRALAFPDFCGLLIGLGLEAYSKRIAQEARQGEGGGGKIIAFPSSRNGA
jgi:hypothetical protein